MNAVSLLLAAWVAFPALAWGIIAERSWYLLRTRRPRSTLFHILPPMAACAALGYAAVTALALVHEDPQAPASGAARFLAAVAGAAALASMAQLLHVLRVVPFSGEPPSRRWLAANYGIAVVVGAFWIGGHLGFASLVSEQQSKPRREIRTSSPVHELTVIRLGERQTAFDQIFMKLDEPRIKAYWKERRGEEVKQLGPNEPSREFFSGEVASLLDVAAPVEEIRIQRSYVAGRLREEVALILK